MPKATVSSLRRVESSTRAALTTVKEELDQHLEGINANTNEIETCYEYLAELDAKLEKLGERLDALQCSMDPSAAWQREIVLSLREQEVFMVLYTMEEAVTPEEVGRRLGFTVSMAEDLLTRIGAKGVPILRTFASGTTYFSLDLKFKDIQARRNVCSIDQRVSRQLLSERAI